MTRSEQPWSDPRSGRAESRTALAERLFGSAQPGEVLGGRYRVRRRIGAGGMGVVDLAFDTELRRHVALKRLMPDLVESVGLQAIRDEARALAALAHPNVVTVYDLIPRPVTVVVMEYVDGHPLHRFVHRAPDTDALIRALRDAGRGLAAAHAAGLVHLDVKPSNILVGRDGRARVCDFGLAHARLDSTPGASDSHTRPTGGTPRYMSPEQHRGDRLGPATDQYSLCATAWAVLTGRPPFGGSLEQLGAAKRQGPPPWPAGIELPQHRILEVLRRGLAPDPGDRWSSMDALVEALGPTSRPGRARWWFGAGVLGLGLWAVAVAGVPTTEEPLGERPTARATEHEVALEAGLSHLDRLEGDAAREAFEQLTEVAALDGRPDIAAEAAAWRATLYEPSDPDPPQTWVERARTLDEAADPSDSRAQLLALADAVAQINDGQPERGATAAAVIADARPSTGDDRLRTFARRAQLVGLRISRKPARSFELCSAFLGSLDTTHVPGHPLVSRTRLDCAAVGREAGKLEDALAILGELVDGETEREADVATGLVRRARLELDLARLEDAERSAEAAGVMLARLHGPDAPQLDELVMLRATIASTRGDLVEARRLLEQLRVAVETRLGSEARTLAVVHSRLGSLLRNMGDDAAAGVHDERAIAMFEASGEPLMAAVLRANRASALAERGEFEGARALLVAAAPELDAHPQHRSQVPANTAWGLVHLASGAFEQAREAFSRARAVQAATTSESHPIVGMLLDYEAVAESRLGLDADATFERAIALQIEGGVATAAHAYTRLRFARHLWETGRRARARQMVADALPAARTRPGHAFELDSLERWVRSQGIDVPK